MSERVPFCAAVDWGTSSFRAWLLHQDGTVLNEARSDEGLTRVADRDFSGVLEGKLTALGAAARLPVIICGMAGSRQGWLEAQYVETPASLDDVLTHAVEVPHGARDIRILPGIAQNTAAAPDVMRGEETQLLGLDDYQGEKTVCMPGTHSKWVKLHGRRVISFTTFLTGELYHILSTASLLRHSVDPAARFEADDADFLQACSELIKAPDQLSARLFSIRAAGLLHGLTPERASAVLSGLLIGAEIGGALRTSEVVLVGSGRLGTLYEAALALAGCQVRTVDAEGAVRKGLHAAAASFWASKMRDTA